MIEFSDSEKEFLKSIEECRLATSHNDIPHVKPVSFILENNCIIIATDYDTRTFKNIKENHKAAISIDVYNPGDHKAICIQGNVSTIENGQEFTRIFQIFFKKFQWVQREPWKENEAPFLKIIPTTKKSWGIK